MLHAHGPWMFGGFLGSLGDLLEGNRTCRKEKAQLDHFLQSSPGVIAAARGAGGA